MPETRVPEQEVPFVIGAKAEHHFGVATRNCECIRGVAVSSPLVNAPPVHRFCVSDDELRIHRLRSEPVVARQPDVVVKFARWGTPRRHLFFLLNETDGFATDLAFVPWRGRRLQEALQRHGWQALQDQELLGRWRGGVSG